MTIDVAALRRIPLFAALNQEDLLSVAALVVERRYERGDIILLEGDRGALAQRAGNGGRHRDAPGTGRCA